MFEEITKDLGSGNMGGAQRSITYGRWADVLTWPVANATVGHEGESDGNVEMAVGANAYHIIATEETVDVKIGLQGELDGKSQLSTLSFFHPKVRAKLLNFMNAIQNEDMFFIVNDNNGVSYLLGDAERGANITTADLTTGTKYSDRNGATLTFTYPSKQILAYTGTDPAAAV